MNTARFLMPIFTLHDFLYLLLDFLLAGYHFVLNMYVSISDIQVQNIDIAHLIEPCRLVRISYPGS